MLTSWITSEFNWHLYGTKFWITWVKLLRKVCCFQLIQNSAPCTIIWRQWDIGLHSFAMIRCRFVMTYLLACWIVNSLKSKQIGVLFAYNSAFSVKSLFTEKTLSYAARIDFPFCNDDYFGYNYTTVAKYSSWRPKLLLSLLWRKFLTE